DTSASRYCYTSTGSWVNQNSGVGGGVVMAKVPVSKAIIYVKNPSVLGTTMATQSSPVFQLGSGLTVPAATSGDALAGTWTDNATYTTTTSCPLITPDPTKRRNLDCETGTATPKEDVFAKLKAATDGVVADTTVANSDVKQKLINQLKASLPSVTTTAPSSLTAGGVQYVLTVAEPTTSSPTTTSPPPLSPSDPFFQPSAGGGYSTTTTSWQVTLTRYSCSKNNNGNCNSPASVAVVQGPATRSTSTAVGTLNSTATFPWFGTTNAYNDVNRDVTQYPLGYGDAYIEGTLDGQLSLVAEHDILLTNNVSYADTNLTTTNDGYAFIAGHDIRVYRPLTCVYDDNTATTSPGWCPNDTTGTYTTLPDWPGYPPATVYKDLQDAPSMGHGKTKNSDSYLYGSIFALRGSFRVDNVARGGDDGNIHVYGGLYMYHRGVTKVQFQGHPAQSSIERPGMTLQYNYDNLRAGQNPKGGLRVPWVPTPSGQVANRTWNITALSSGS
ncbi:hypothetical protein, partial [Oryzihumus sp.]|uniref:hypothetical protein n=1 Tax=Oryzihumus sp. TaxID=1968903 RepID=UPI002EDB5D12